MSRFIFTHTLSSNHWIMESFSERMTTKQWRQHLLNEDDKIVFNGYCRLLVGKSLGCGVVEVSKQPLSIAAQQQTPLSGMKKEQDA